MIDWMRVMELRNEIGADDFDDVVELFLCEVEERIEGLDHAKPTLETQEDLHFLKGSSLNLGFEAFAKLCNDGEQRAEAGEQIKELQTIRETYFKSKALFLSELSRRVAA